ncbi:enteropeptidase [Synchiropus picturatus]
MKRRLSSLEILLCVVCLLLLVSCISLIVVTWFSLNPRVANGPTVLHGTLVVTEGAEMSEELKNSSSSGFKSLAFDVENLVRAAFSSSSDYSLSFLFCQVLSFTESSSLATNKRVVGVKVTFDLLFNEPVDDEEVGQRLRGSFQDGKGLVVDRDSILITGKPEATTTTAATPVATTAATKGSCPPHQTLCADQSACVDTERLCDGVQDCADGSDETSTRCATPCDGQFLLLGPSGSFSSSRHYETYNTSIFCRWIIRVERGFSVRIDFLTFETEELYDVLKFYDGVGGGRQLNAELSGTVRPGTVWLLTDESTVEFSSDDINSLSGFNATFTATDLSGLTDDQKLSCTFEDGFCFWRQQQDDDGDWIRARGATFPPLTGPSADHTLGNQSGFYITTPPNPGQWPMSFRIQSPVLMPSPNPMCLKFWYHMYGEDVHQLRVLLVQMSINVVFQKDGNYGDNWNYGQVTLQLRDKASVVFEALKNGGRMNEIALDDIVLISEPCGPAPPEPTNVPLPPTMAPIPPDCGGPFDLWEPNSTFSTPNYPTAYGNEAHCVWTLHAPPGQNIHLHFLDFDIEATYDVLEVRDGAGPKSTLLAVLTGSDNPTPDLFSTTNLMTVQLFTDASGNGRGFRANFSSGFNLGSPAPCAGSQFQCQTGECIHGNSQCDGQVDCPDASDEADCVELQLDGSRRLEFQIASAMLTVCADNWNQKLSDFTCQYLGYRSAEATMLLARPEDSPFAIVTISKNESLEATDSKTCSSKKVVSLSCGNEPCGVSSIKNATKEGNQSTKGESLSDVRVVGGVNAVKGAWPWAVSLHWKGRHVCGASLIDNEWLLTAAHCVYGKNLHPQLWTAKLGLHSQLALSDAQTRDIDHIVINRQYNRLTKQADAAMMHLKTPANFTELVQPVCLPEDGEDFPAGQECFIAGWGRDSDGSPANILQEAMVPLVAQDQCQRQLPEYNITSMMMCAGYPEGGVDSCQGDSGGPLMMVVDGHWSLIGVTSFGKGCGLPGKPGVYARVSAFIPWIADTRRSSSLTLR